MINYLKRHIVGATFSIIGICFIIHCMTMSYSPMPWIDEIQIIEIAQGGLVQKTTTWSMCFSNISNGEQFTQFTTWAPYYLGGLIQETGYQLLGRIGPRFFSLCGFLLASIACFFWVKTRTGVRWHACICALLVFSNSFLVQSVRGVRVDIYCITLCFLICYLLNLSNGKTRLRKECAFFTVIGGLVVIQPFVWVSSIMMWGLVLAECIAVLSRKEKDVRLQVFSAWVLSALVGAGITLLCILTPFLMSNYDFIGTFISVKEANTSSGWTVAHCVENIGALVKCFIPIGVLALLGAFGLLQQRIGWIAFSLFSFWIVYTLGTRIYVHRFVYFIPYFIYGVALLFSICTCRKTKIALFVFASFGIALGLGYSVVVRNILEFLAAPVRQHEVLKTTLSQEVGNGPILIYMNTFEPYYVGRELGWRMLNNGYNPEINDTRRDVLDHCQYFLEKKGRLSQEAKAQLLKNGFVFSKTIIYPVQLPTRTESLLKRLHRPLGFGPYELYTRQVSETVAPSN